MRGEYGGYSSTRVSYEHWRLGTSLQTSSILNAQSAEMTGTEGNIYSELASKAAIPEASPAFHGKDRQVSTHINQTDRHTLCEIRDAVMS